MNEQSLYTIEDICFCLKDSQRFIKHNDLNFNSISIDTRNISRGSIFLAIKGDIHDGHNFIDNAINKGASLIICSYIPERIRAKNSVRNANIIIVQDTIEALVQIAKFQRSRLQSKVIAITGNIGKTTIKEMIASVLGNFFKVHYPQKSFNNHIGLPLTLVNAALDTDILILEMGMNHKGEIAYLTDIAKPDIAIITTIAPVHTEFFENIEEIAKAKAEIFQGMNENGIAILNQENKYYDILLEEAKKRGIKNILNIGLKGKSHVYIEDYKFNKFFQTEYKLAIPTKEGKLNYNAVVSGISYHSAFNTLFIFALARLFKLDNEKVIDIISTLKIFEGRGNIERVQTANKEFLIINDSYNSSPEALKSAINSLGVLKRMYSNWKTILIIGDMLELGKDSLRYHLSFKDIILENKIDKLLTVGEFTNALAETLKNDIYVESFKETRELVKVVRKKIDDKSIVLLKASNSMKFGVIVNKLYR